MELHFNTGIRAYSHLRTFPSDAFSIQINENASNHMSMCGNICCHVLIMHITHTSMHVDTHLNVLTDFILIDNLSKNTNGVIPAKLFFFTQPSGLNETKNCGGLCTWYAMLVQ